MTGNAAASIPCAGWNNGAKTGNGTPSFMKIGVLVATVTALGDGGPRSNRGPLCPFRKPTIDSKSESIVATPAIFIGGGDVENVKGNSYVI